MLNARSLRRSVSVTTAPDETQSYKIPLNICERLPALPALPAQAATCRQTPPGRADPHCPPPRAGLAAPSTQKGG